MENRRNQNGRNQKRGFYSNENNQNRRHYSNGRNSEYKNNKFRNERKHNNMNKAYMNDLNALKYEFKHLEKDIKEIVDMLKVILVYTENYSEQES